MPPILVADADARIAGTVSAFLERSGATVLRAQTAAELVLIGERQPLDVAIIDLSLAGGGATALLARLHASGAVVIATTPTDGGLAAAEAFAAGAEWCLVKPLDLPHLAAVVARAVERARLRRAAHAVVARRAARARGLLGSSPALRDLAGQVEMLATGGRTTVLLVGESGTGKGRLAEYIHARGARSAHPFVEVRCAALGPREVDAALFGRPGDHADEPRSSAIDAADGGTLFLDEVAALASSTQRALRDVLDTRRVRRVDAATEVAFDARLIASTARDLVTEVTAGRFREDLYYQLSVMPLYLPPLRARAREDVELVVASVVDELAPEIDGAPRVVTGTALGRLVRHSWPGNVRELRNVLERSLWAARGAPSLDAEHLPAELRAAENERAPHEPRTLEAVERAHIERTLRAHNANRTHAARELGISRATLIKKIHLYGL